MKKIWAFLLVAGICCLGLGGFVPPVTLAPAAPVSANPAFTVHTPDKTLYYGRNYLFTNERQTLVDAYDTICNGIKTKTTTINLASYNLRYPEFKYVYELYCYDHPEHFWRPNGYSYSYLGGSDVNARTITAINFVDQYAYLNLSQTTFNQAVNEYLALVNNTMSQYEIALTLHDALVENVDYVTTATNAHNPYGPLVEGKSVCEGYAEAYQYLLQLCGIQSYAVCGMAGELHEWNLVRLDGEYYYTDVTWDDPTGSTAPFIYHSYFNVTTDILRVDHEIYDTYNILPPCTKLDKLYTGFAVVEDYQTDAVREIARHAALIDDYAVFSALFTGDPATDNYNTTWNGFCWNAISAALGNRNRNSSCASSSQGCAHYFYIQLTECPHTAPKDFISNGGTAPTCLTGGRADYYRCPTCKQAFTSVTNDSILPSLLQLELPPLGHQYAEPAWTWADDGRQATATFTCTRDSTHTEQKTVTTTGQVITAPTEETDGLVQYTATITIDGETYSTTHDVTIPAGSEIPEDLQEVVTPEPEKPSFLEFLQQNLTTVLLIGGGVAAVAVIGIVVNLAKKK